MTPHTLRHSMLTLLAELGWQPEPLQERAGPALFQQTYQNLRPFLKGGTPSDLGTDTGPSMPHFSRKRKEQRKSLQPTILALRPIGGMGTAASRATKGEIHSEKTWERIPLEWSRMLTSARKKNIGGLMR